MPIPILEIEIIKAIDLETLHTIDIENIPTIGIETIQTIETLDIKINPINCKHRALKYIF